MTLDAKTQEHIRQTIGSFEMITNRRKDDTRTGVMEVSSNSGRLFIKIYSRESHWHRELYAYTHWTKAIEPFAPKLISSFQTDNQFGIIITPIGGRSVHELQIQDNDKLKQIYQRAGQLFKKMQKGKQGNFFGFIKSDGTPLDDPASTNPVTYVSGFIEMFYKSLYDKKQVDTSFKPLVEKAILCCDIFADEVPVLTNWDLSPRNWMVDNNGNFAGFIDFENTSWGISLDSFGVITHRYAYDKPDLVSAFFKGYGLTFDEGVVQKMRVLDVKMALGEMFSGHALENQYWIDSGNRVLRGLLHVL